MLTANRAAHFILSMCFYLHLKCTWDTALLPACECKLDEQDEQAIAISDIVDSGRRGSQILPVPHLTIKYLIKHFIILLMIA